MNFGKSLSLLVRLFLGLFLLQSESCGGNQQPPAITTKPTKTEKVNDDKDSTDDEDDEDDEENENEESQKDNKKSEKVNEESIFNTVFSNLEPKNKKIVVLPIHGRGSNNGAFKNLVAKLEKNLKGKVGEVKVLEINGKSDYQRPGTMTDSIKDQSTDYMKETQKALDAYAKGKDMQDIILIPIVSSQGAQVFEEMYKSIKDKYKDLQVAAVSINGCVRGGKAIDLFFKTIKDDEVKNLIQTFGYNKFLENLDNQSVSDLDTKNSEVRLKNFSKELAKHPQDKILCLATDCVGDSFDALKELLKMLEIVDDLDIKSLIEMAKFRPKTGPILNEIKSYLQSGSDGIFTTKEQTMDPSTQSLAESIKGGAYHHVAFIDNQELIAKIEEIIIKKFLGVV